MKKTLREYLWENRFNITAREFSKKLDIHHETLSRIVHGHQPLSMSLAKKIEEATGGQCKWHEIMDQYHTERSRKNGNKILTEKGKME
jgi:plasmid maintenance system antidote protein VapI